MDRGFVPSEASTVYRLAGEERVVGERKRKFRPRCECVCAFVCSSTTTPIKELECVRLDRLLD